MPLPSPRRQPPKRQRHRSSMCVVTRAVVGTVESALEISGTLAARTRVGVKPKLPGRLEQVLVDVGDRVRQGQVVATIDRGEIDAQVDSAIAAVAVAKAALESAEADSRQRGTRARARQDPVRRGCAPASATRRRADGTPRGRCPARPRQGQSFAGGRRSSSSARSAARCDTPCPRRRVHR